MRWKLIVLSLVVLAVGARHAVVAQTADDAARVQPRAVILIVGSGLQDAYVGAAGLFANGTQGSLGFEQWPYQAQMTTSVAGRQAADAAAAATALATGVKVDPGVLSVNLPGNGFALETVLEYYQRQCKRVGVVTTGALTNPTAAAFLAHQGNTTDTAGIWQQYLSTARPDVLLGGGVPEIVETDVAASGYVLVRNRVELAALTGGEAHVVGAFGAGALPFQVDYSGATSLPTLSEMTAAALKQLETSDSGFFLLIHSGRLADAAAQNDLERTVIETLELARTADFVAGWASTRPDTLVMLTSDYAVGGFDIVGSLEAGELPFVSWYASNGTGRIVPVYATGTNADLVSGLIDHADVFDVARAGAENLLARCGLQQQVATPTPVAPPEGYPATGGSAESAYIPPPMPPTRTPSPDENTPISAATATPVVVTDSASDWRMPQGAALYPLLLLGAIGLLGAYLWRRRPPAP